MSSLKNKRVILAVSGGIAAYKSADLVRKLRDAGAEVRVVMTKGAEAFVTALTFQALSGNPVHTELLDTEAEAGMGHIELARWGELLLVAPASANTLARLAHGLADDLLGTLALASKAPLYVAPAMNQAMWAHSATQANVDTLRARGARVIGPDAGSQACGDVGEGRMTEPLAIVGALTGLSTGPLTGVRVTLTAGPTREALDPVRYISNHSSGKMGYALAQAFTDAGAQVRLISGPVNLPAPAVDALVQVNSAQEMLAAALADPGDCFVGAAAVADYRPATVADQKIKKQGDAIDDMTLALVRNPDIIAQVAMSRPKPYMVGFAAETQALLSYARDKLVRKKLDLVIANDVSRPDAGFNVDTNTVTLVDQHGDKALPSQSKTSLARELVNEIAQRYQAHAKKA
ncbi:bifunctional phosphopantothenoylcysteine decarboxylase/phosphopantothenate--cysteine ligase CoaBC [Simiduia agarivorans]|uniref:Coenzyme A biosynthesis bifunctional protein CoaBC n=1 Tax=Simiduia agarivorans (strain DSM 21679 / JCM 13881 / BCRC 17597 / SA1) TaxID=1117647 RepID=K4KNN9_SIMAS|nr:bifunctional phosphopantothenoylcysteine decarboxylase/phosphopantothenate--cysteine ligase CoaBC [Simiduia agarivorans]AFU99713.2 phosphopantothenoylcysteine decarboxylase/phosphopantothenate--cysteine ligase [Simiduia agarivorans SA1 = DSM 21679]